MEELKNDFPKYLSTFDSEGNRTATYLCESAEEVEHKKAEGCIEISKEDWNTYIGNKGDGIRYVRGADGKPTPYVETLAEVKQKVINAQYLKYEAEKYAIAWVGDIGFDTDKDSQTDWLSVVTVLQAANATKGYYKVYTDKNDTSKKEFREVTLEQLKEAGNVSRAQQTNAYASFERVKAEINSCTTKEEVQMYIA